VTQKTDVESSPICQTKSNVYCCSLGTQVRFRSFFSPPPLPLRFGNIATDMARVLVVRHWSHVHALLLGSFAAGRRGGGIGCDGYERSECEMGRAAKFQDSGGRIQYRDGNEYMYLSTVAASRQATFVFLSSSELLTTCVMENSARVPRPPTSSKFLAYKHHIYPWGEYPICKVPQHDFPIPLSIPLSDYEFFSPHKVSRPVPGSQKSHLLVIF